MSFVPRTTERRCTLRAALIATTALVASMPHLSLAQTATPDAQAQSAYNLHLGKSVRFNIPAQPLAGAISMMGRQAGVQVSMDSAQVAGMDSAGLSGLMTVENALHILLQDSGLPFAVLADGAIVIGQHSGVQKDGDAYVLPLNVEAESDDTLVQDGYVAFASPIGTKKNAPLVEVPHNISVITQDQLQDRNPRDMNEALAYTPGINVGAYGFDPRYDAFAIRGFNGSYTATFRDGLRQFNGSSAFYKVEPYGLEGLEILKGPSSTLYGASSSGGLVNQVTKRPTKDPLYELELGMGLHNRRQANFDISDALTDDKTLKMRLTGLVRKSDTVLDGFPDDREFLAPAVSWVMTPNTKLTILSEYMHSVVGGTEAYYNDANGITDLYGGDARFNDFETTQYRIGYEFEHRFNDTFTFRENVRYTYTDIDLEYAGYQPAPPTRGAGRVLEDQSSFVMDNHLISSFQVGNVHNDLTTGVEYASNEFGQQIGYGAVPDTGTLAMDPANNLDQQQYQIGIYAHNQMRWEDWRFTQGLRYDSLDSTTTRASGRVDQKDDQLSWQFAVAYVTDFGVVPFANYTTSFTPNIGEVLGGAPAKPTVGKQQEIGVKYELPDQNAIITASFFNIDQKDGIVFDASSGRNIQVQQNMRSRGFELEGVATLENGLSLNASYAYTDMEIKDGAVGTEGKQVSGTPKHAASLYADYTFQQSMLKGFGFGVGVRYQGESYGNDANTIKNGSRYYLDGGLHYDLAALSPHMKNTLVRVNATNLLDERKTTCTSGYCYRDEGLNVMATIRHRF
jgi:iron complex outermembrane receptor protein